MKRIPIFFSILVLLFTQCKSKVSNVDPEIFEKTVRITGTIHNRYIYPNAHDLELKIKSIAGETSKIICPIQEDSTFYFEFELNQAQDVVLDTYIPLIYITPGDSLHIDIDFNDLMHVKLSGDDNALAINQDITKYFDNTFYRNPFRLGTYIELNSTMDEIIMQLEEIRKQWRDKRNAFLQENKVHEAVVFLSEAMIELDYYSAVVNAAMSNKNRVESLALLESLMEEMNRNVTQYFSSQWYCESHFNFIRSGYMSANYATKSPSEYTKATDYWRENNNNNTIRDFALAMCASSALRIKELELFEELYSEIKYKYLLDRLMKEYEITLEKMNNPGAVSDYITGKHNDMLTVATATTTTDNLIAKSISKNLGKVHVIDIWSRGCAPCIEEFDQYKILIDEYAEKNVSFSFIGCSGDNEETRALLRSKGIPEKYNYFCNKDEYTFLARTFSPMSFPYGILINRKGEIVDYGSLVRPSVNLRAKIDLLLKQDILIK